MEQFPALSKREWEVFQLLLQGKSNKLIASALGISTRTVEFHLKNIYAKFQVSSRIELILKLGNTTGKLQNQKLGHSTVDNTGKIAENRDEFKLQMNWVKSLIGERNSTMHTNFRNALQNALKGYAPAVFLVMAVTVLLDGVRFFMRNQDWKLFVNASIRNQNFWEIFLLELLLLTGGYIFIVTVFNPKYINFTWWRSAIAGVGAVSLLALLSILVQPVSLTTIVVASFCTGMMSVLFMLRKTPQASDG
jgi:DNA-binding CsgD family transcriptional regulator